MRHIIILITIFLAALSGCQSTGKKPNNTITIFHAGSLSKPLKAIADSFMHENPGTKVLLEAAGSVECARKIAELGRECDLMFSADYKVIDKLLIPKHADWNILFAGNEMTLVYTTKSKYAEEINSMNWHEILLKPDVFYGRSDPDSDPCGYRTILTLQLAEKFYKVPELTKRFVEKDRRFVRPKEVDLLALLESGALDYIFLYRSVAIQHGLPYIRIPDEINLGAANLEEQYSEVSLKIRGSSPGDTLIIVGEPMVYGFTIPKNAPNVPMAQRFAEFFLSRNRGLELIERSGMPLVLPLIVKNESTLPTSLKPLVESQEYKNEGTGN